MRGFWLLLLLPVFGVVGWVIGQLPGPATPVRTNAAPAAVAPPPMTPRAATRGTRSTSAFPDDPRPADSPGQELSQWTTMTQAVAESRRNGKPILIDFNAGWCRPCQALRREVFDDGSRGRAVQMAVIPVSIVDRVREDGHNPPDTDALQARYGVEAFPTLVVYSPATGRSEQARGFGSAERTLAWIQQAAKSVR